MSALPLFVQELILSFLPPTSLCRAASVCKVWKDYSESDKFWKQLKESKSKQETTEQLGSLKQLYVREVLGKLWASSAASKSVVVPTVIHSGNSGKLAALEGMVTDSCRRVHNRH